MPMQQLDLFAAPTPPGASPPAPATLPEIALAPPLDVLPGQVGLFEDRTLRFAKARTAIGAGRLEEACRELHRVSTAYPGDTIVKA